MMKTDKEIVMSIEQNKANFRAIQELVLNTGDFYRIDELFAAEFIEHAPGSPGVPANSATFKAYFTMLRNAFPNLHYTSEVLVAEGDLVAGYLTANGTQTGEFMGVPATGKQVTWTETHIGRYADGKLVEHWLNYDQLGLMQQLGVIPSMG